MKTSTEDERRLGVEAMAAAVTKLKLAIQLLQSDDNDVAEETIKFIQHYLDCLRHAKEQIDG